MRSSKHSWKIVVRILTGLLLLAFIAGCASSPQTNVSSGGSSSSSRSTDSQNNSNSQSSSTSAPPDALLAQNPNSEATIPGLLTLAPQGEALGCNQVVLATDRLTYSSDKIQQMGNFLNSPPTGSNNIPEPDTLANVQGGYVGDVPNWGLSGLQGCMGDWEITNIGQGPIQIAQINMQLASDPQPDNYQYRFVDRCSLPFPQGQNPCAERGGGAPSISYNFSLGQASASTVIQGQSLIGQPVIGPGQSLEVQLGLQPADSSISLIYTLTPEIVLNTPDVSGQVFNLSVMTSTIALTSLSQFSCYHLQGSTLAAIQPSQQQDLSVWCE
jgi:hypothetical protein